MPSVQYMALRDGKGCQQCGSTKNLTRDHIWPKSKGGCSCEGNFQLLCEKCNTLKGNFHDGVQGHRKTDCPEAALRAFRQRWKAEQRNLAKPQIEALIPEMEALVQKLSAYQCNPLLVQQAHSMVGSLRAYVRDFRAIREQQQERKPVTLEKLRATENRLVQKLKYVREQIEELERK